MNLTRKRLAIFGSKVEKVMFIFSNLGFRFSLTFLMKKFISIDYFYLMTFPLKNLKNSRIRNDIFFRQMTKNDWINILSNLSSFNTTTRKDLISRYFFYNSGLNNCYIGHSINGDFISIQWLITPEDNSIIKKTHKNRFKELKPDQVMVENIFIFPTNRSYGAFSSTNNHLLKIAKEAGYGYCLSYIKLDNILVMNEYMRLGFTIKNLVPSYTLFGFSWRIL